MVRVIIERHCQPGKQAEMESLLVELRTKALRQREDLADKVIAEVNLTDSATASDVHGHGTKVASIIAATAPNARLLNVKVADDTGLVWPSPLLEGIVSGRWSTVRMSSM